MMASAGSLSSFLKGTPTTTMRERILANFAEFSFVSGVGLQTILSFRARLVCATLFGAKKLALVLEEPGASTLQVGSREFRAPTL